MMDAGYWMLAAWVKYPYQESRNKKQEKWKQEI